MDCKYTDAINKAASALRHFAGAGYEMTEPARQELIDIAADLTEFMNIALKSAEIFNSSIVKDWGDFFLHEEKPGSYILFRRDPWVDVAYYWRTDLAWAIEQAEKDIRDC